MNTRLIVLLFAIAAISVSAFLYFFFRSGQPVQEVQTNTGFPIAGQNVNPALDTGVVASTTQKMSLPTTGGGSVAVENFLNDPETVADPVNSGYYDLGYSTTNTPPFMITYIATTQYFNIELLQEPIGQTRELAQQYLEQHLGISSADLCKLNYTISAPTSVSILYGGASLGFSFCPGATTLPK